jgi:hypothetical protein
MSGIFLAIVGLGLITVALVRLSAQVNVTAQAVSDLSVQLSRHADRLDKIERQQARTTRSAGRAGR